jgi:GT2 family glycosyltransferase
VNIALVIVNFNSGYLLVQCIEHVLRQTRAPDTILVVDNASEDKSIEMISQVPGVTILRLDENVGFAAANNRALEQLPDSDLLVTLNPDAFPAEDFICKLEEAALRHPEFGSFACRMMRGETTLDGAGDAYHLSGLAWRRGHNKRWNPAKPYPFQTFSACAGAAMYRVEDVRAVGGFDESFFCYMEDVDLGYRLMLAGRPCAFVPEAVATHIGSATSRRYPGFADFHGHRNLVWVVAKNTPWQLLPLVLPLHLIMTLVVAARFIDGGELRNYLRAKRAALSGLKHAIAQRKHIHACRKASAWQVLKGFNYALWR